MLLVVQLGKGSIGKKHHVHRKAEDNGNWKDRNDRCILGLIHIQRPSLLSVQSWLRSHHAMCEKTLTARPLPEGYLKRESNPSEALTGRWCSTLIRPARSSLTALSGLGVGVLGFADLQCLAGPDRVWRRVAGVEHLTRDDPVDLCVAVSNPETSQDSRLSSRVLPARMFWKASSTLLASSAEVSMNERLFSPDAGQPDHSCNADINDSATYSQIASPPPSAPPAGASNRSCSPPA